MGSSQSWRAAFTGSYDEEELDLLVPYIEEGSVILDIGASLGFYTIPLALIARERDASVIAVEPVPANCTVLRRNAERNGVAHIVTILQCALGRVGCEAVMHVEHGGRGNATIVSGVDPTEVARHDRLGRTSAVEHVSVFPLDQVKLAETQRGSRCCLIKMDVEGFEMDVLAGAGKFVAANRPVILAEFHPVWLKARGVAVSRPQEWAIEHEYDCSELTHHRTNPFLDKREIALRPLPADATRSGTALLLTPR